MPQAIPGGWRSITGGGFLTAESAKSAEMSKPARIKILGKFLELFYLVNRYGVDSLMLAWLPSFPRSLSPTPIGERESRFRISAAGGRLPEGIV